MKKFLGFKIKETKKVSETGGGLTLAKLMKAKKLLDEAEFDGGSRLAIIANRQIYKNTTGKNAPRGMKFPLVIQFTK